MQIKIGDVAKLAGVSPATVSRVINGTANVEDALRDKVLKAMSELRYEPNTLAQSLRKRHLKSIGVTVSDIERKEFAYEGAGYDPYDVDQYLDQICDEMVAMQDRIAQLEKELEEANRAVEKAAHAAQPEPYAAPVVQQPPVAKTSETLESILINAQTLADDAAENANRKAAETIEKAKEDAAETSGKAQVEADEITGGARAEKERIEAEYATLKEKAQAFKEGFLKIIQEHKSLLDKQLKENKEI